MLRSLLMAGLVLLGFATASFGQYTQQRQDDPGIMSVPSTGTAGAPGAAPSQQTTPIPTTTAPTIVNQGQLTPQQLQQLQQLQQQPQRQQAQPTTKPAAEPIAERNEFQEFITASTGKRLPIFGFNLFEAPSTFAPVENIPVTGDYVIGPGDELLIRAWGQIDVDYRALVDRNGMINIPRVGSIPVAGVQFKDLTAHVRTAVSRNFRNFELLVTLGQLRSIQVFVVGNAQRPGAY